jgi:hypothetical protein
MNFKTTKKKDQSERDSHSAKCTYAFWDKMNINSFITHMETKVVNLTTIKLSKTIWCLVNMQSEITFGNHTSDYSNNGIMSRKLHSSYNHTGITSLFYKEKPAQSDYWHFLKIHTDIPNLNFSSLLF